MRSLSIQKSTRFVATQKSTILSSTLLRIPRLASSSSHTSRGLVDSASIAACSNSSMPLRFTMAMATLLSHLSTASSDYQAFLRRLLGSTVDWASSCSVKLARYSQSRTPFHLKCTSTQSLDCSSSSFTIGSPTLSSTKSASALKCFPTWSMSTALSSRSIALSRSTLSTTPLMSTKSWKLTQSSSMWAPNLNSRSSDNTKP